jgi:hypothetical protein
MISYDKFFWEKFMKRSGAALKKLARFALVEVGVRGVERCRLEA